jgi:YD repeat-containing protein
VLLPLRDALTEGVSPPVSAPPAHPPRGPSQSKRTGGGGHAKTQSAVTYQITETYRWPTNSLPTIDMKIEDRPPDHRIVKRVNANGDVTHWFYEYLGGRDARGNGMYIEPNYYQTRLEFVTNGQTTVTYRRGDLDQVLNYYYDPSIMRVTKVVGPNNTNWVERYEYDSEMNITNSVIRDTTTGEYVERWHAFDDHHNVTNETVGYNSRPSNTWYYTWDTDYQVMTSVEDPEGHKTVLDYTNGLLSRVALVVSSNENYDTRFSYTSNGLLAAVTNANGHWIRFSYDNAGYVTNITSECRPEIGLERNEFGYVRKIILPWTNGVREIKLGTDERGRITSITYPNNLIQSYSYDPYGNVLTNVDTGGRATRFSYTLGNLALVNRTLEGGGTNHEVTIRFDYHQQLNLLRITDPLGREVQTYQFDPADRVTSVVNIETQRMTVTYGVSNYVSSIRRFDESRVDFKYDGVGRLSEVAYQSVTSSYSYLANGLVRNAENETGVVSNQYNSVNRLVQSQVSGVMPQPITITYSYFPDGQVSNVTSVVGGVTYSNDAAERVARIASPEGTFNYQYGAHNGRLASVMNDSGLRANYSYDQVDRITQLQYLDASSNVLRSFRYEYSTAGMITNIVYQNGDKVALTYDTLDRLTGETRRDMWEGVIYEKQYRYDLAGNRTATVEDGVTNEYTLGVGNRLLTFAANGSVSYDLAGNVTNIVYNDGRKIGIIWNDRYQVTAVYTNGGLAEKYEYDALGRRVSISDGLITNYLIYDGIQVIAEVDPDGKLLRSYTYGGYFGRSKAMGYGSLELFFLQNQVIHRLQEISNARAGFIAVNRVESDDPLAMRQYGPSHTNT